MLTAFHVGQTHHLGIPITRDDLARYVALSGDTAPLHVDAEFAKAASFDGVVVHGAYLMALVSRLVGTEFPGPRSVLERADIAFRKPCYAPCDVTLAATVRQVSEAVATIVLDIAITDDSGTVLASGKTWHRILDVGSLNDATDSDLPVTV
ncbi:MaoC/PaaZ C-terminal domain-containing protein [Bradyrhizobium japonicum]|uniref:MaoC/PaaZ C-terminal domain-containing protein n=1 Tax=Bradyrhizobium japonicum TaxID=375 RepID=UPI0003FB8E63|nr:MaoC/PaaZ C-terminal domain-containing protein [Bradyrhizobium japonicum]WLB90237.1 MaoC/PaaZ C-terminal domain-containing protein [Bradyrhizobium japonicum USDA 135]